MPAKGRAQPWEIVASFAFGVVFIIIMLAITIWIKTPTDFQMLIFRIVISIAVGGIGAVIPGFIIVNVQPYVRAGGGLAVFAVVYLVNPPALVAKDYTPFSDAIRQADVAATEKNYTRAITFFEIAKQTNSESWIPYYGLGKVYYKKGQYALSLQNFKQAFKLKDEKDGALAYSISINEDALGAYEDAEKTLEIAASLQHESPLYNDIIYDQGLINLLLWQKNDAPNESQRYQKAISYFLSFLDRDGSPIHWTLYHMACLEAIRTQDPSLSSQSKSQLRASAINNLEKAVVELSRYPSDKAISQRQMMRAILTKPSTWVRQAGMPIACPDLIKIWSESRGSVNNLLVVNGS